METKELTPEQKKTQLFISRLPEVMALDPKVPFRFMNQDLQLEMNNVALMGIYKDTGINILGDGFKAIQLDNPEVVGVVLFRALNQNHPDITQEQVNKAINARQYFYIRERIMESLSLFMPKEEETPEKKQGDETKDNPPA